MRNLVKVQRPSMRAEQLFEARSVAPGVMQFAH
jgi:hypothetical protein